MFRWSIALAGCLLLAWSLPSHADDWQCNSDMGCTARINEDGEIEEHTFRKGDLISTDAGWHISPDDGWVKLGKSSSMWGWGNVYQEGTSRFLGFTQWPLTIPGSWLRPVHVRIPISISLVGIPPLGTPWVVD